MKTMTKIKLGLAMTLLVLFTIVVLQNTEMTTIKVFAWEFSASRIVVLVAPAVLGVVVGFLLAKLTGRTGDAG